MQHHWFTKIISILFLTINLAESVFCGDKSISVRNSNLMNPILLDRYLEYLPNATSLDTNRILFLAWLVLQNTIRSDFMEF
jgi:hypothetical protein